MEIVNEVLRPLCQASSGADGGPAMVLKLIYVWNAVAGPDTDYDLSREAREKRKEKEIEESFTLKERQDREQLVEKKDREDSEWALIEWLVFDQRRRVLEERFKEIADIRRAAQWAYERAIEDERTVAVHLEKVRAVALVLSDGRRAYFTRDGSGLYAEDGSRIMDSSAIAEAARQRREWPTAPSYEDFVSRRDEHDRAAGNLERLRTVIGRLNDLESRIRDGNLSFEDLAAVRHKMQGILDESLPAEAREKYERLRAVRRDERDLAYRAADPAFTSEPPQTSESSNPKDASKRAPVYKPNPDF